MPRPQTVKPAGPPLVPKWPGCGIRVVHCRRASRARPPSRRLDVERRRPLAGLAGRAADRAKASSRRRPGPGSSPTTASTPRRSTRSDLGRARRTAEIIGAHLERPVVPDDGLRERNGGEWQGRTGGRDRSGLAGDARRVAAGRADRAARRGVRRRGADRASTPRSGRASNTSARGTRRRHASRRVADTARYRAGVDPQTLIPNLGGYWFAVAKGELTRTGTARRARARRRAADRRVARRPRQSALRRPVCDGSYTQITSSKYWSSLAVWSIARPAPLFGRCDVSTM